MQLIFYTLLNHELFTLCEDAATDFLHPLLEQLHAAYVKTPKAEWPALEEKIIVSTIDKLTNAEKFVISCYIIEHREDVSDDARNPLPDKAELKEWLLYLWHCAFESKQ